MKRLIDRQRRLVFETPLLIGKRPLVVMVESWGLRLRPKGCRQGLSISWAQVWNRAAIIAAAKAAHLPAIYQWREFAEEKGLMSYGTNLTVAYTLAGTYAGLLIDPASTLKPTDLPILTMNNGELIINLKTARDDLNNLTIPPALLQQADEVIVA